MAMSMAASHARDKRLKDAIFGASAACREAAEKYGADKVTNATMGVMMDDEGKLASIPTMERIFRSLSIEDYVSYAPISGLPAYLDTVIDITFADQKPDACFASIATAGGSVPLAQIAHLSYAAEDGFIKRHNLRPSIMVQAEVTNGEGNDAALRIYKATEELRRSLPAGTTIETAGALADSADSMHYLMQPLPAMIFIIMTLLMLQLGSMGKMTLTLLTAPMGLIGVAFAMLVTDSALGFVAYLGVLALFGMIIRNSVILIDQIKKHEEAGEKPMDAIIDSAVLRFRPIMLTAAAAILGMLPLMRSIFWGPMAVAIAGGLIVATVLTLLVLPVMYAVAYRVRG